MDLDSLRPLLCQIESAAEVAGHTEYAVHLTVPHVQSSSWHVQKRYNDFVTLASLLEPFGLDVALPPKKAFGNKEREFIAERQTGLQNYLAAVIASLALVSSKTVKQFLHTGSRMTDASNSALQFLSMVFRTDNRFETTAHLPEIGWRMNKEFASVKCTAEPKSKFVGSWTFYGPSRVLTPLEISALLTSFCQIKHPLFYPLVIADARETGCATVRPLHPQGSLWDVLKGNKITQTFVQKCGTNRFGKPLSIDDIQRIGRQVLETLKFFHDNSIPYGNLNSRNVFLDKNGAHVSDIESGICGLRTFYWPFIVRLRKLNTFEAVDIYCFGHLLYEMAFGRSCETPTCDNLATSHCPPLIRAVLESILTPEACRGGMPTVSQLLTQPLFSDVVLNYEPVSMKMSRKLKEALVSAKEQMEAEFVAEQKLYYAYVKNQKAYSIQSSEDERKKRRLQALKSQTSSDPNAVDYNGITTRTPTPTAVGVSDGMPLPRTPVAVASPSAPPPPPPPIPPLSGPPPPPPPMSMKAVTNGQKPSPVATSDGTERNALLASIRGFRKDALAAAETVDKSGPYIA